MTKRVSQKGRRTLRVVAAPKQKFIVITKILPKKLGFMNTSANISNVSSRASSGKTSPVNARPKVAKKTMKAIIGSHRVHLRNRRLMAH